MEERQNQGGNLNPVVNEEPMTEDLSEELERKFYDLDEVAKGKGEEETVQIRMHQLAIAKVLVFAYNKNDFQLVKAHAELGWAYLNFKCYEQSIDHLTISLKKNSKLNDSREAKEYNHRILKWLGKCYLESGNIEDAIEILHNAYNDVKAVKGEQDIECAEIQTILSNCYRKCKDFKSALECLDEVKFIADSNNMSESERVVQVHVERAQVFMDEESYPEAIQCQMEALKLLDRIKSDKHEYRADLLNTLSIMQEKTENFSGSLDTLMQIRDLYNRLYGEADKRTLKIKRHLALSLLRAERNDEALQELLQTEEIETGIFGEDSVQVAKTQKIIGTLFLVTKEYAESLKYLNKAMKIFHENGAKNMVAEIRKKIQMIKEIPR